MVDQIRLVLDDLDRAVSREVGALSVNIVAELIERTPVDVGWARANWVPGVGGPTFASEAPTRDARQSRVAGQGTAQATATAALATGYRVQQGPVFISNGAPYIGRLNEGSSSQAPAGFVQDAIIAAVRQSGGSIL